MAAEVKGERGKPQGDPARRATLWALGQVLGERRVLSDLAGAPQLLALSPADRARANRLTRAVLAQVERADRLLKPHLAKAPPLAVRNALRLGLLELAEAGDAYGVVHDLVAIIGGGKRTAAYGGLVNAVLRKLAPEVARLWPAQPVPRLPPWLRQPLVAAWGRPAVEGIEAAHLRGPTLDLTVRDYADKIARLTGGELLPTGSVRVPGPVQVTTLPAYDEGIWWVQDAAAALPVRLLGDLTGLRALDLCAAPGGKTMQLAAAGASVMALDSNEARLMRLQENLARTGLTATASCGDALAWTEGGYDVVVLDAPCSATGTIRRHPDLPHARDGAGISDLIALQARLIDHALTLLAPGGRLLFCTCSLIPDEGEVQVDEALARHPGLRVVPPPEGLGVEPHWISSEGGLRLRPDYWPERGGMDGFYMAVLSQGG